jgi:virulence-associated protein VapD
MANKGATVFSICNKIIQISEQKTLVSKINLFHVKEFLEIIKIISIP